MTPLSQEMESPDTPGWVILSFERALVDLLTLSAVPDVNVTVGRGHMPDVSSLVQLEETWHFRGMSEALETGEGRVNFWAKLGTNPEIRLIGDFSVAHLTCSTAKAELAGTKRHFMLGYIQDVKAKEITFRPLLIADRIIDIPLAEGVRTALLQQQVHVSSFDAFSTIDWGVHVPVERLELLRQVSESEFKATLAHAIGEPVVPKDWGGETSDLFTTRLRIEGRHRTTAFLLKGPGKFKPMDIAALGVRGDQIDRLFREPADLLVIQHCHRILPAVINMMRAYASDFRNPRQFVVIDGFDTFRILESRDYFKG